MFFPATYLLDRYQARLAEFVGDARWKILKASGRPQKYGSPVDPRAKYVLGAMAEKAASMLLNMKWHDVEENFINIPDVGDNVQVRQTEYENGHLLIHHDANPDDVYLLALGTNPFRFKGWIEARDGMINDCEQIAQRLLAKEPPERRDGRFLVPQYLLNCSEIPR